MIDPYNFVFIVRPSFIHHSSHLMCRSRFISRLNSHLRHEGPSLACQATPCVAARFPRVVNLGHKGGLLDDMGRHVAKRPGKSKLCRTCLIYLEDKHGLICFNFKSPSGFI